MVIWLLTATSVALAMDYVVGNELFMAISIWNGASFDIGYFIWKSILPTAIGNMAGGELLVGAIYCYLYLTENGIVDRRLDEERRHFSEVMDGVP